MPGRGERSRIREQRTYSSPMIDAPTTRSCEVRSPDISPVRVEERRSHPPLSPAPGIPRVRSIPQRHGRGHARREAANDRNGARGDRRDADKGRDGRDRVDDREVDSGDG